MRIGVEGFGGNSIKCHLCNLKQIGASVHTTPPSRGLLETRVLCLIQRVSGTKNPRSVEGSHIISVLVHCG